MNKVYIQQIEQDQSMIDSNSNALNVRIRVKNSASLEEYTGETFLNPQYLDKVQRWVKKNKFSCVHLNNDLEMELKVEIFKFNLSK